MRIAGVLLIVLFFGGCKKAPDQESARQAVLERLTKAGMPVDSMDIKITAFEPKGNEAEATVSFTLKEAPGQGMVMKYRMEQQSGKWVVTGIAGGDGPHGSGGAPPLPSGGSPHGGSMPAPEDLPPAGKKK